METGPLPTLFSQLGIQCSHIDAASKQARETRAAIEAALSQNLAQWVSLDTSLVVFGSLARNEFTRKSDVDWTYLIDGQANSDHLTISREISEVLRGAGFKGPNPQGAFASMVFSHDLIHQIGGQEDTNRNMTQRMLLLLESVAIGERAQEAYERVMKGVISRYLEEGSRLLTSDGGRYKVPRFLLNDVARFWRTMAVDFASKQRDRGGRGWGLRNLKLRMSRKLLFASGLLTCFSPCLDPEAKPLESAGSDELQAHLIQYLRDQFRLSPLEVLGNAIRFCNVPNDAGIRLFESYDEFLGMLDDDNIREKLEKLRAENASGDSTFKRVREISRQFQAALDSIFFENKLIWPLTKKYGVF